MKDRGWQFEMVETLADFFEGEAAAKVFVLSGSLAGEKMLVDAWSDVDIKVVMADETIDGYFLATDWLTPIGQVVGLERHASPETKTLRLCLDGMRRIDIVFFLETALLDKNKLETVLFRPPSTLRWSRLDGLHDGSSPVLESPPYQRMADEALREIVDAFWYKAAMAITKTGRNDLLIGLHLALDLARDVLLLQMLRRDQALQTNVHRTGDWGNEIVADVLPAHDGDDAAAIIDLVARSCFAFDELAATLLPDYEKRRPLLLPYV